MTTKQPAAQQARAPSGNAERLRRIGFLLVPEFTLIAFTSALEPLRMANRLTGKRLYEWQILSVDGGPVHASNGLIFTADVAAGDASHLDLVLLLSISPALLLLRDDPKSTLGYSWLFGCTGLFLLRLFLDPVFRRPPQSVSSLSVRTVGEVTEWPKVHDWKSCVR